MSTLRELVAAQVAAGRSDVVSIQAELLRPRESAEQVTEDVAKPAAQHAQESLALAAIQRVLAMVAPGATVAAVQAMPVADIMGAIVARKAALNADQLNALRDDVQLLTASYAALTAMGVDWRAPGLGQPSTAVARTVRTVLPSLWAEAFPDALPPTLEQIREVMP